MAAVKTGNERMERQTIRKLTNGIFVFRGKGIDVRGEDTKFVSIKWAKEDRQVFILVKTHYSVVHFHKIHIPVNLPVLVVLVQFLVIKCLRIVANFDEHLFNLLLGYSFCLLIHPAGLVDNFTEGRLQIGHQILEGFLRFLETLC